MDILATVYFTCILVVVTILYIVRKCDDPLHWTHRFVIHRIDMIMMLCAVTVLLVMIPIFSLYHHHQLNP